MTKKQSKRTVHEIAQEARDREAQILAVVTAAGLKGCPLDALVAATGWPDATVRTVVRRVKDAGLIAPTTKGFQSRWVLSELLAEYRASVAVADAEQRRKQQVIRLRNKAARKRERARERERQSRAEWGGPWTKKALREAQVWADRPVCLGVFPALGRPAPVTTAPRSVFELAQ